MISCYFREKQRYSKSDIMLKTKSSEEQVNFILKKLKEYGVVKTTLGDKKDLSDLIEDTEEIADVETSGGQIFYVFTYVGVITLQKIVFKIYPKYLPDSDAGASVFRQVMSVLKEPANKKSSPK